MLCRLRCCDSSRPASVAEAAVAMDTDWQPCAVCGLPVDSAGGAGAPGWLTGALNGRCLTSTHRDLLRLSSAAAGRRVWTPSSWQDFLSKNQNSLTTLITGRLVWPSYIMCRRRLHKIKNWTSGAANKSCKTGSHTLKEITMLKAQYFGV